MSRVQAPAVRRAQIVEAAKRRFREAGFHTTTMTDIAAQAGVSVGLLYRYFPSKDDIIRDIIEADLEVQLQTIEGALDAHPDDQAAALDALIADLTKLAADRDRTLLMLEIAAETARSPTLGKLAFGIERRAKGLIAARFGGAWPEEERETRIRLMMNMFTALGLDVYRDPSNMDVAVRLTTQAVRRVLDLGADPT